ARIHIAGASGAGTTSLARPLAARLGRPHFDGDDFFWLPTTPPYHRQRELADRLRLMRELFLDRPDWILSGGLAGWGDSLIAYLDLVVFLSLPTETRLTRIRAREAAHFGAEAIAPGGYRHREAEEFIEWASHY